MPKDQNPSAEDDFSIDFDPSTLDDSGKKVYETLNKQFREAYLKKTGSLAENRRGMEKQLAEREAKMKQIEAEYEAVARENQAFKTWWETEGQYQYNTPKEAARAEGFENPDTAARELAELRRDYQRVSSNYDRLTQDMNTRVTQFENALRLQHDLFDLRFKHPNADPMKIIDTAKEKGITNLELAYNLAYGDENLEKVREEARAEGRMNAEEEYKKKEAESKIVESSPKTTRYAPAENAKSYSEASASLLNAVRGSGGVLTD